LITLFPGDHNTSSSS